MFKQLGKFKDKAKKALDDLANTIEHQLVPRARSPVPVRVPVSGPRRKPFRNNYRDYSTSAPKFTSQFQVPVESTGLAQYALRTATANSAPRGTSVRLSQKLCSFYRTKLVESAFQWSFVNVMTRFTVINDKSRFYNSLTNTYDNVGCRVMMNNPLPVKQEVHGLTVSDIIGGLESKMAEITWCVDALKSLQQLGDLPASCGARIAVHFDNLTKKELSDLLADQQADFLPITENLATGWLSAMNKELFPGRIAPVRVGLSPYRVDSEDLSGSGYVSQLSL
ncbi:hypothetical protein PSN45_005162 [Yamadazyma tenuis]|uniref:Uncharacterized protein n=1 Tax=Candida tenuis (strain ATCC 10573 / BCRC 21748 / CBS 615 / JCM 9827 / NBRC 10315 / NRRL Y-1498 / VKM Y-70) TaxID=590646 RepID=G3B0V4_CANTC|nr:uncharacterized protein CANTEDRAFT_113584 [Yamadazyma tenuis ATCC 10573]EGV64813.1 hypothetical protein CANTEDRAFT_113584 [Yamadazyma tenuis ATCC 10573]WEJ97606.1 hypothetical protein PSN45_005162 [Yamadazyma tenuis]